MSSITKVTIDITHNPGEKLEWKACHSYTNSLRHYAFLNAMQAAFEDDTVLELTSMLLAHLNPEDPSEQDDDFIRAARKHQRYLSEIA